MTTETIITILALALGAAMLAYGLIADRLPRKSLNPRLIPPTPVMFLGVVIIMLSLLHLATIGGLELPGQTGRK